MYFWYLIPLIGLLKAQQVAITKDASGYTFWYNSSCTRVATFTFDYCDIVDCPFPKSQIQAIYKDIPQAKDPYICVVDNQWGHNCDHWGAAGWNTGPAWGYKPKSALSKVDDHGRSLLQRMTLRKPGGSTPMKLVLNIEHPGPEDAGQYVMGMYWRRGSYNKLGHFYLNDMCHSPEWQGAVHMVPNPLKPHIQSFRDMMAIANPTFEDTMAAETGFNDINLWLEWMRYNANKHNRTACYVCGGARPHLGTVPLILPLEIEECFLSLFAYRYDFNRSLCETWTAEYPILVGGVKPPDGITIYKGNYTCYTMYDGIGKFMGNFSKGYCATYRTVPVHLLQHHTRSLGDIYWLCGDLQLRSRLESSGGESVP
ncbi:uncharacterized protein LOC134601727 [Pelobates fuscus]|uniref:uncharacterized protein LOC134601727 n=1 Tax=Pelobates fuscus TaxID=191477 RepID=UPI002FE46D85